ncbi:DNA-binding domain-containing protein [Bacillus sp. ISL-4]|nr:DNA-binding domain-containing protein [Bacillus sp. ISL-4]MBT2673475.1 DNA-binding domain-containing protein [Streptomyces sp. ISL-14]
MENYATKFLDFATVRQKMTALQKGSGASSVYSRINVKKFFQVLYFETKR